MRKPVALVIALVCLAAMQSMAQTPSPKPKPSNAAKPAGAGKGATPGTNANPGNPMSKLLGGPEAANPNEPTITEIYSDEAFFDSNKSMGIFTGRVKVNDPRFNLQSDKLTVFITKSQAQAGQSPQPGQSPAPQSAQTPQPTQTPQPGESATPTPTPGQGQGLEKAIAEGHVAVIRDRPDPAGGAPSRSAGRSEKAIYEASTGNVELTGSPRVQQGVNTHIATSPDTVMIINANGQLTTHGPSRTEIRQEPNQDENKSPAPGPGKNEKPKDDKKPKEEKAKENKPKPS
jgi:lipopolysaccharide export system protein LptA